VQKTWNRKGKGAAVLRKHSWRKWDFIRDEKSIPGTHSWRVWGVQVLE
jgi:hypothetical protein